MMSVANGLGYTIANYDRRLNYYTSLSCKAKSHAQSDENTVKIHRVARYGITACYGWIFISLTM